LCDLQRHGRALAPGVHCSVRFSCAGNVGDGDHEG
jgi:hypothetical protein